MSPLPFFSFLICTFQLASGYYGPLIDNITLTNEIFRAAVEVAGGNALFHIVVDTDATAAVLINELERLKAGRLTFLPLNRYFFCCSVRLNSRSLLMVVGSRCKECFVFSIPDFIVFLSFPSAQQQ